jgi:signal transduction histidine kinase/CheY-like chemotaxis protein
MFKGSVKNVKAIAISALTIIVVITFLVFFISNYYLQSFIASEKKSVQYYTAIEDVEQVMYYLAVIESNERGYILGGNAAYISNIEQNINTVDQYLKAIDTILPTKKDHDYFVKWRKVIFKKVVYIENVINLFNRAGMNSAANQFKTLDGFRLTNQIVADGKVLQDMIRKSIDIQYAEAKTYEGQSKFWNIINIIVLSLVGVTALLLLFSELDQRSKINIELEKARAKADLANVYKRRFMANMSHDVRTPVHAILGFSDLLLKTELKTDQREFVKAIFQSSENLLGIVNDVLDYSKVEEGKLTIIKEAFSLHETIQSVVNMFKPKIDEKKILLGLNYDNRIPASLLGDKLRISQILFNLIGNAVKFTDNGRIEINAKVIEEKSGEVFSIEFLILDSGIGIKSDRMQAIFDRFEQAEDSTTQNYGGSGLGLSIVKQLVELHSGSISAFSIPGVGSEFKLLIDFEKVNDSNVLHNKGDVAQLRHDVRFNKVLLVEDNELNQKLCKEILISEGVEANIVNNGKEAIDILRHQTFDLIFMDLQMPVMSGLEASSIIRNELKLSTPIVAFTSNAIEDEYSKCKAAGMNAYIEKPMREGIINKVSLMLQNGEENLSYEVSEIEHNEWINLDYLYHIARGNQAFMKDIMETFLRTSTVDLESLQVGISNKDYHAMRMVSHKMRSSIQYMGIANDVDQLLKSIEVNAEKQNNISEIHKQSSELEQYFKHIHIALKQKLEEMKLA